MKSSLIIPLLIAAVSTATSAQSSAPPQSTALPLGPGQCGGIGYTGPTDCYDPYYDYLCVIVTDDYWACALQTYYTCEDPDTAPQNGEVCYVGGSIGGTGQRCCANSPEWQCIYFTDEVSRCLQVVPKPPSTVTTVPPTTTTVAPPPTVTACSPNWGQCGGQGWTGPTCCQGAPDWTCTRSNDFFSTCLQQSAI